MRIDQILKNKGREVVTLSASETLQAAARLLDEHRIGATVVLEGDGSIVGVLSERDIVRRVGRDGAPALSTAVADAMTRDVVTARPDQEVEDCLSQMSDRRIRHLPIVFEGRLTGIVSIGDLVKWKIAETEAEADAMKAYIAAG